jgi:hypothetical protein
MLHKEKEMEKKGEKCSGMRVAPTEAKLLGGEGAYGTTIVPDLAQSSFLSVQKLNKKIVSLLNI